LFVTEKYFLLYNGGMKPEVKLKLKERDSTTKLYVELKIV